MIPVCAALVCTWAADAAVEVTPGADAAWAAEIQEQLALAGLRDGGTWRVRVLADPARLQLLTRSAPGGWTVVETFDGQGDAAARRRAVVRVVETWRARSRHVAIPARATAPGPALVPSAPARYVVSLALGGGLTGSAGALHRGPDLQATLRLQRTSLVTWLRLNTQPWTRSLGVAEGRILTRRLGVGLFAGWAPRETAVAWPLVSPFVGGTLIGTAISARGEATGDFRGAHALLPSLSAGAGGGLTLRLPGRWRFTADATVGTTLTEAVARVSGRDAAQARGTFITGSAALGWNF